MWAREIKLSKLPQFVAYLAKYERRIHAIYEIFSIKAQAHQFAAWKMLAGCHPRSQCEWIYVPPHVPQHTSSCVCAHSNDVYWLDSVCFDTCQHVGLALNWNLRVVITVSNFGINRLGRRRQDTHIFGKTVTHRRTAQHIQLSQWWVLSVPSLLFCTVHTSAIDGRCLLL